MDAIYEYKLIDTQGRPELNCALLYTVDVAFIAIYTLVKSFMTTETLCAGVLLGKLLGDEGEIFGCDVFIMPSIVFSGVFHYWNLVPYWLFFYNGIREILYSKTDFISLQSLPKGNSIIVQFNYYQIPSH